MSLGDAPVNIAIGVYKDPTSPVMSVKGGATDGNQYSLYAFDLSFSILPVYTLSLVKICAYKDLCIYARRMPAMILRI